jgi:hypothetical protein
MRGSRSKMGALSRGRTKMPRREDQTLGAVDCMLVSMSCFGRVH